MTPRTRMGTHYQGLRRRSILRNAMIVAVVLLAIAFVWAGVGP